ncbi:MAG TPA: hypothetical protein VHN38_08935, partial [Immundisolibacter sp.]|nr:hypothetical protein [Immundisolibacter sp.]
MQQVRGGMVGADARASGDVYAGSDFVTLGKRARPQDSKVKVFVASLSRVGDIEHAGRTFKLPLVAHLPTRFRIKRRGVQGYGGLLAGRNARHALSSHEQIPHACKDFVVFVAAEILCPNHFHLHEGVELSDTGEIKGAGGPGPFALLGHGLLEA